MKRKNDRAKREAYQLHRLQRECIVASCPNNIPYLSYLVNCAIIPSSCVEREIPALPDHPSARPGRIDVEST